jgi:hypothetical protein
MRGLLYALSVVAIVGLAFWAYREGYQTRDTERAVAGLQREIGRRHQELSMLRAEWAYLNRPDRLSALAEMNFESLGLMPLAPDHFAQADQVAYPVRQVPAWPAQWTEADLLEEEVDGVIVMFSGPTTGPSAPQAPVPPPTMPRDGEQLP